MFYSEGIEVDQHIIRLERTGHEDEISRNYRPSGSGYVVDTFWSTREAMREKTFEDVARSAIAFGEDAGTTSCVACGLAGIKCGLSGIP